MKTLQFVLAFAVLSSVPASTQIPDRARALVIEHAQIIDVVSGRIQHGMTIVVRGDRIAAVAADVVATIPPGAQVVNASGLYVLPGLWDMHVHTFMGKTADHGLDITLPLLVANGVTGIRDMGSDLDAVLQARDDVAMHRRIGPRMVVAGPMLDGPQTKYAGALPIASAEEGRRAVSMLKRRRVDFIKVQSQVPRDAYFAIADECNRHGLPLVGHVPDSIRAAEAVRARQRSFEHLIGVFEGSSSAEEKLLTGPKGPGRFLSTYDAEKEHALARQLVEHHVWQVPTLYWERGQWLVDTVDPMADPDVAYIPTAWRQSVWPAWTESIMRELDTDPLPIRKAFVEHELEVVARLHRAGVPFLAGTDAPAGIALVPGFSLHRELGRLVAAGFTPVEALQTATIGPARFLGRENDLGTVAPGKVADLLLLDADPTKDISNTRSIRSVIAAGRYLSRGDLDEMLARIKASASQ